MKHTKLNKTISIILLILTTTCIILLFSFKRKGGNAVIIGDVQNSTVVAENEININGFKRPLISVTFDDGDESQFQNGVPILDKYEFKGTFFLVSGFLNKKGYMTDGQIENLIKDGHQIASHSVDHVFLPNLEKDKLTNELLNSRKDLSTRFSVPINDFSVPSGAYLDQTLDEIAKYYRSNRTIENGLNEKSHFDSYKIKANIIQLSMPVSTIDELINKVRDDNAWLVLIYHDIDKKGDFFSVTPENFDLQMQEIKKSGITVVPEGLALDEILPQLTK